MQHLLTGISKQVESTNPLPIKHIYLTLGDRSTKVRHLSSSPETRYLVVICAFKSAPYKYYTLELSGT